ncbi:MAG: hypothetical protein C0191_04690 [Mucilaginibacter sp.]|nr:MAG: hypothetical protein C0191_04690 [Mucilaginibacter sp.]HEK22066.1 hypothetical protein [Bacteroidota bacterium]
MTTPVSVQIQRATGQWSLIEVVPVCSEQEKQLVSTGIYQLYEGFPDMDDIEHFDDDSTYFLGELHFTGFEHFEWKYVGQQLNQTEVEHIVDLIQAYNSGPESAYTDGAPSIPINPQQKKDSSTVSSLTFLYVNESNTLAIRLEENEGHYVVYINGGFAALLELRDSWEVTSGVIFDPILLGEIIRFIEVRG